MKALIQRGRGRVYIDGVLYNHISSGYVILIGVCEKDTEKEADLLAEKTFHLRIMSDDKGKMNLSIAETGGEILVISQFTLYADLTGGRRPSFIKSAKADLAEKLYLRYIEKLKGLGIKRVVTGKFGTFMQVEIVNDGPVTIMVDSAEFKK